MMLHACRDGSTPGASPVSIEQDADRSTDPLPVVGPGPGPSPTPDPVQTPPSKPTVFVGSVKLDGSRVGRAAGRIADEVLAHLVALPRAKVDVTLEVHVHVAEGISEDVVRTVSENATALKFDHSSFERD